MLPCIILTAVFEHTGNVGGKRQGSRVMGMGCFTASIFTLSVNRARCLPPCRQPPLEGPKANLCDLRPVPSADRAYTNGRLSSISDEISATKALMGRVESFEEVAALPIHIKVSLIHPLALLPNFASDGAAGADLHACMDESRIVDPGERVLIPTGGGQWTTQEQR